MIQLFKQQVDQFIWQVDEAAIPYWQMKLVRFLRIIMMVLRDLSRGMLTLRAMSLVYTTLLSFVPLLAVSFSVLKGFGVHNQIEPVLLGFLEPLGEKSVEITNSIVGFVENMKIGVLGAVGLGFLMVTVISLIQKIESAFNYTWRISSNRNLSRRFSSYLSVVMVGPVLIFSAVGIMASFKSHAIVNAIETLPYMGDVIRLAGWFVPYLLIIAAFTFVYILVPNTRVKFKSALYGAIVAGILWRFTGVLFASFAGGSTSYTAIYSGFAILLLFMIWLYLGWLILLIGASISFYHQHPERLRWKPGATTISAMMGENLALQLMVEIGREHYQPRGLLPTQENLAENLKVPQSMVVRLLNTLTECGLIVQTREHNGPYLPARSIDRIKLIDILRFARQADDHGMLEQMQTDHAVTKLQQDIEACVLQAVGEKTLQDLVLSNID